MSNKINLPNKTYYRKIIAQGYVELNSAASSSSVTVTINHGLGYAPDYSVFCEDYNDRSLRKECDYIIRGGSPVWGHYIDLQVTASSTNQDLFITLNTPLNSSVTNQYYLDAFTLNAKYLIYESVS